MGWMQGFIKAAGEDAHQQNLLDIQTKVEKHKAFTDHLRKISEDPSYTPEAQQTALQKYQSLMQAGPMKSKDKDYDLSDVLTVKNPSIVSAPGAPKTEGGAPDYANPIMYTPSQLPGEPELSRPGKWSPFEQSALDAQAYQQKMSAAWQAQQDLARLKLDNAPLKTSGRAIPIDEKGLAQQGITQRDGVPYPKGNYYLQWMSDNSARVTPTMPTAGRLLSSPVLENGEWVYKEYDPRTGELSTVGGQGNIQVVPPRMDAVAQMDDNGIYWRVNYDRMTGKEISRVPFQPSAAYGSTSTGEQFVFDGRDMLRMELTRTTTPRGAGTPTAGIPGRATMGDVVSRTQPQTQKPSSPQGVGTVPTAAFPKPFPSERNSAANSAKQAAALGNRPLNANSADAYTGDVLPGDPKRNIPDAPQLRLNDPNYVPPRDTEYHLAIKDAVISKHDPRANVIPRKPALPTTAQVKTMRQDESVYRNTLRLLDETVNAAEALDSFSGTMKLYFMTSFNVSYKAVARALLRTNQISKDEYNFAIAYNGLREHIQKMRGPLGAAGFRSLEAFMSLQAQRGEILDNPIVTRGILRNSMKTFLSLYGADRWALSEVARSKNGLDPMTERWYQNAYSPSGPGIGDVSPEDYETSIMLDGWSF